jgi:hypothetical protein
MNEKQPENDNFDDCFESWPSTWSYEGATCPYLPEPNDPELVGHAREKKPLIVIDSLISMIAFADRERGVRRHMHMYRRLTTLGATVLLLHRPAKGGDADYHGISDLASAVDSVWRLRCVTSTAADPLGTLALEPYKTRAEPQQPVRIKYLNDRFEPVEQKEDRQ